MSRRRAGWELCGAGICIALLAACTLLPPKTPTPVAPPAASVAITELPSDRWDLGAIYPDDGAFAQDLRATHDELPELSHCRGRLSESAKALKGCLGIYFDIDRALTRLTSYASLVLDQDTQAARGQTLSQQTSTLGVEVSQAASFFAPEIIAMGAARIASFEEQDPGLGIYRHPLAEFLRQAPHTLHPDAEELMAGYGLITSTGQDAYDALTGADISWPRVTLSDGTSVMLDPAHYSQYRAVTTREDRKHLLDAFFNVWRQYADVCGVTLAAQVKAHVIEARARHYPNSLAAALSQNAIPVAVYDTLIAQTHAHLDTLHRYEQLRKRLMGLPQLAYYDLYPPLTAGSGTTPLSVAKQQVVAAVAPLGPAYQAQIAQGLNARWMDAYPRPHKRSGAYENGDAYGVHPYVLLNYTGDFDSVTGLAHEFGHAMHSVLANETQPYATSNYPIFIAEVASTTNEALLARYLMSHAQTRAQRLYVLGAVLENLRITFFRQALLAEFEAQIHAAVEHDETLTADSLNARYGALLSRYYGADRGLMTIDPLYSVEWAYIPHLYYDFYVYQYATSIAAASLFADRILSGQPGELQRYLDVLRAGGSRDPYELLRQAGVDLASPAPYEAFFARMNHLMDEIEHELAQPASP